MGLGLWVCGVSIATPEQDGGSTAGRCCPTYCEWSTAAALAAGTPLFIRKAGLGLDSDSRVV